LERSTQDEEPNGLAFANARRCAALARGLPLAPDHVTASAIGGVALTFVRGRRIAMLEGDNEGEIVAMLSDRATNDEPLAALVEPTDAAIVRALTAIKNFVGGPRGPGFPVTY
jgi:hypothetical protein